MTHSTEVSEASTMHPSSSPIMVTIPWIQQTILQTPTFQPKFDVVKKHDNKLFWLLTIYSLLTDKEFISGQYKRGLFSSYMALR